MAHPTRHLQYKALQTGCKQLLSTCTRFLKSKECSAGRPKQACRAVRPRPVIQFIVGLLSIVLMSWMIGPNPETVRAQEWSCRTVASDTTASRKMGGPIDFMNCGSSSTSPDILDYLDDQQYRIPVVVHAITGSDSSTTLVLDTQIRAAIDLLNQAFAGGLCPQDSSCSNSQIVFDLVAIERTADDDYSPWDMCAVVNNDPFPPNGVEYMEGHQWDPLHYLNIYVVEVVCQSQTPLIAGFSTLPWGMDSLSYDGVIASVLSVGNVIEEQFESA